MKEPAGKRVLVTGAASGIGRGAAGASQPRLGGVLGVPDGD